MKEEEEIEITPEEIEHFRQSIARAKALKKALEKAGVLKEIEELERGDC
ncbi:hypothetical protein M1N05_01470 [Dehalococcoidales bacterium]|nr:hypothetical protein [Dehalococcoidales bacterium]